MWKKNTFNRHVASTDEEMWHVLAAKDRSGWCCFAFRTYIILKARSSLLYVCNYSNKQILKNYFLILSVIVHPVNSVSNVWWSPEDPSISESNFVSSTGFLRLSLFPPCRCGGSPNFHLLSQFSQWAFVFVGGPSLFEAAAMIKRLPIRVHSPHRFLTRFLPTMSQPAPTITDP